MSKEYPAKDKQVLLVEDNRAIAAFLKEKIRHENGMETTVCTTMKEVCDVTAENADRFSAALVDLTLPDSPKGEVLDVVLEKDIPAIVLSGSTDENLLELVKKKPIIDYFSKQKAEQLDYAIRLINRLARNPGVKVLVVDDTMANREYIAALLMRHRFSVLKAASGEDALELLGENPDIRLVISDYIMPGIDGVQFVSAVRQKYGYETIAIIGLSGEGERKTPPLFLKAGANDYMVKGFSIEEFYCRVNQNVNLLESMDKVRDLSFRDSLTGLYNRRYLFSEGETLYQKIRDGQIPGVAALVDIDHFKGINDTYGHAFGDVAIKAVASAMDMLYSGNGIVARIGGEEFCVLLELDPGKALAAFERLRREIEKMKLPHLDNEISLTISIGVSTRAGASLEEMIHMADERLYEAKTSGRNRTVVD